MDPASLEEAVMPSIPLHPVVRAAVLCVGAVALVAGARAAGDRSAYEQARQSASSSYETARNRCDAMSGNARDICVAEAKATRTKAEQRAELAYEDTPKTRERAKKEIAEADYKVARERCNERSGNDKDVCIKVAKAVRTRAEADAKAERKTVEARNDAAKQKREADYKVAAEKCEALSGDAKSACVAKAKARYGM
jgi:hypothetical protein